MIMHPQFRKLQNYARLSFLLICVAFHYVYERISNLLPTGLSSLELDSTQRFGRLRYKFKGQVHTMIVPYNIRNAPKMSGTTVRMMVNGHEIDVTQPSGIPYLYSAQQIGGTDCTLTTGEEIRSIGLQSIPLN